MHTRPGHHFDIAEIPFSVRGSWLDLSPVVALHTRRDDLHLVSHQNGMHGVLSLVPEIDGQRVETTVEASPSLLSWVHDRGTVDATFDGTSTVRLRGRGVGLRIADAAAELTPFTGTYLFTEPGTESAVFTSYETGRRYRVTRLSGRLDVEGDGALGQGTRAVLAGGDGASWEVAVEEFTAARAPYETSASFESVVEANAAAFEEYLEALAPWRGERTPGVARAAYVLWSATVSPLGYLGRESILMSKHWMDKVWSWDHAFNALALAPGLPDIALDQFLAPFDYQDDTGAPPDSVTHSEVLYNYVKPPIHGWALAKLRERMPRPLTRDELADIYSRLSRWSTFWLDFRRAPGRTLPYYQHGNDSGWDNSTTFDVDRVIESPDLAAFLVVQLDVLAGLADELGEDATRWRAESASILDALLEDLWDGENFVAIGASSGRTSTATSLLNLLPILAAHRLPQGVRSALASHIERHVTEYGPATEIPGTALYEPDGYWRGPIWAPSTVLIESGLRSSGFAELADRVSERFRALCEKSGFAENFDAVTGEGLRDRAYSWTASSYLLLADESEGRRMTAS
ncbi:glycogen debranching enzyme [Microbacteriaceae bacterium SG_E_30_P1]|uniref:Glycogen debranching enzyme n=1 Tax=Antiquaquibacter oligotrophicus TaxID=2880260 RepID=A0ABT6KRK2_9MICO|nr:trehalase family glycosidase [Antiquaquibacter oligotrophicus]MDH6182609.1 glycogen debranching enzyme [Antiquaquibacter oligotrophicus]UDF14426.1 glycogen debranching protein [Antiquaquibacter oligotrophicus]